MKDFLEQGKDIKSDCLIWPSIEHGLCQDPENITLNYVKMHFCWIKLPNQCMNQTDMRFVKKFTQPDFWANTFTH